MAQVLLPLWMGVNILLQRKIILILCWCLTYVIFIGAGGCNSEQDGPPPSDPRLPLPQELQEDPQLPAVPLTSITLADPPKTPEAEKTTADTTDKTDTQTTPKDTAKPDCKDIHPPSTGGRISITQPPCCRKEYEDIRSLIVTGQGNTWVDDARKLASADLESDGKKADDLIGPLITQAGHKPQRIALPGVTKKGAEYGEHTRLKKNTETFEKAIQELSKDIDPNKKTLVIIGVMDHGSMNGSTALSYSDIIAITVKYIHGCVDLVFIIGGCESSGFASAETLENAVQTLGSELLAPEKEQYRKDKGDPQAEIPPPVFKQMMDKVYLQMPKVCSMSVHYSARARENGLPKEENLNYCDGGFFVAWYRGFVNGVNKAGGSLPIKPTTLAEAFNAADAHNTNTAQHPGVINPDWNGAVDQAFDKK